MDERETIRMITTNKKIISKVKSWLNSSDGSESKDLLKYIEILEEARDIHRPVANPDGNWQEQLVALEQAN
jgi:hypothetical protein|tara:strand:+ start:93 stop:305 length:213 start_codon:yes stop_codon:yes gene_type:complete